MGGQEIERLASRIKWSGSNPELFVKQGTIGDTPRWRIIKSHHGIFLNFHAEENSEKLLSIILFPGRYHLSTHDGHYSGGNVVQLHR